jgi:hypothetical protein
MIATLRHLPGFERLSDPVLELIVQRSAQRRFAPGQLVLGEGAVAEVLFGCIEGAVIDTGGGRGAAVFDAPGLLFGLAARGNYCAGPDGAAVIAVAKPHVFTIVREFPEFVVSLLTYGENAA